MLFVICCFCLQNQPFQKGTLGIPSECQTSLDPAQAQRFVGPDLGPNCLQRLSTDGTSRQRVKLKSTSSMIDGKLRVFQVTLNKCLYMIYNKIFLYIKYIYKSHEAGIYQICPSSFYK